MDDNYKHHIIPGEASAVVFRRVADGTKVEISVTEGSDALMVRAARTIASAIRESYDEFAESQGASPAVVNREVAN